jgi:hypothetical protein
VASNFEGQETLEAVVASLPKMAEYLASIPDRQKTAAADALERHYLQTALGLGCSEEPARIWVAALMAHVRERLELMTRQGPDTSVAAQPKESSSLVESLLTRAIGAVALLLASPLIALIWIGLKLERADPAMGLRATEQGSVTASSFVLGSGWVSRLVRRADLQSTPMLWHLVNGDAVLRFKDFAAIIRFPSARRRGA